MKNDEFKDRFQITNYEFSKEGIDQLGKNPWGRQLWPLVYILSDESRREAYVGETQNVTSRLKGHWGNPKRRRLKELRLITSEKFNKSATLDLESSLISYMAADGKFKMQNGNGGIFSHNYYQREKYQDLFEGIWEQLRKEGLVLQTLKSIDNSDLFKFSPYKALTYEQLYSVQEILQVLANGNFENILVRGAAGTGKTVLAIFIIKLLVSKLDDLLDKSEFADVFNQLNSVKERFSDLRVALVVPMTSLRVTLKKVFSSIDGLAAKMVIGPSEVAKKEFDILLVDEAHRLKRRVNLTAYGSFDNTNKALGLDFESDELDWILKQSRFQIFFYDPDQTIKPTDIPSHSFEERVTEAKELNLWSQLRVKGGGDYLQFVDRLLHPTTQQHPVVFESPNYELKLFDSLSDMIDMIKEKEEMHGLSRLAAGYAWKWKTKLKKGEKPEDKIGVFDIEIEDQKLVWNREPYGWINSPNAINEVGCIHTTQGYDLNYIGVIFGNEISYNPIKGEIQVHPENYFDRNGKSGIQDLDRLKMYIINIYKTLMYRGILGTYVYVCNDELRNYLKQYIPSISASISPSKTDSKFKFLSENEAEPFENCLPYYDIQVAAGDFSSPHMGEVQWISVPSSYAFNKDHFVCQVRGESMNQIIPDGSYCLFKKYYGGSRNKKVVLVQHEAFEDVEFGAGYTVKEYHSKKTRGKDSWRHESIILKPLSSHSRFQSIELEPHQGNSLRVLGIFVTVLN